MKVMAIYCKKCDTTVFSRAKHDCRDCQCGSVSIDGGRSYTKISVTGRGSDLIYIKIKQRQSTLYYDWLNSNYKYGHIEGRANEVT